MKKDEMMVEQEQELLSRREYLVSLKKWSKVVIGGVVLGGMLAGTNSAEAGWVNRRGGWVNGGGGGWINGGGGGGWINGGGGGWINRW
ncbi:predicted membrane protein [Candidatus Moduliflexus flocculans]|uniref:Predicted membrane protein n=1 Tax=Candidatus Moduliflexus flocculans TaxID=1499966 RepID=A0A0S6W4M9_9BACT|nr:predicted membrane protein [Candidatus Moduliflexus flocculans]